jgi:hypothetical protein
MFTLAPILSPEKRKIVVVTDQATVRTRNRTSVFLKSMAALLATAITGFVFVQKGDKHRSELNKIDGLVVSIDNSHERYAGYDTAEYRYLLIDFYSRPFQLFIGKDALDLKPAFENIDRLRISDTITIYYDENSESGASAVNHLAYFIDRGNENIFTRGNPVKYMVYGLISFCGLIMTVLIILKLTGRIV